MGRPDDGRTASSAVAMDEESKRELDTALTRGKSRWVLGVAFLVLLAEQSALGFQLIAPALPQFAQHYQTTQVIWAITAFTLTGAVVAPLIGKLGDRYGKRKVLIYIAGISTVGCVISALAPTFEILIVGRVLTAFSIGFAPITYALIRDVFPKGMREISISIATNGVGVVTIAGPFLAGYLLDNHGIGSIFWFVAVISVIGAIGTILLVPETPIRDVSKFDIPGVVGLTVGAFMLLFTISQVSTWGPTSGRTLLLLAASLVVLAGWWRWESHQDEPFVSTHVLKDRATAGTLLAYALVVGAGTMMSAQLPTLLQTPRELAQDYGFGASATGVAGFLVLAGVLTVASGLVVGTLGRKTGFRSFLVLSGIATGIGAIGLATVTTEVWGPVLFYGFVGIGAMVYAAGPNLMMQVAPTEQRGVSAAMLGLFGGVLSSVLAQMGSLILNQNTRQVVGGLPIYDGSGVMWLFLTAACIAVLGSAAALLVPRKPQQITA